MKKLLLLFTAFLFTLLLQAQSNTGTISGTVLSAEKNQLHLPVFNYCGKIQGHL